MAAVTLHQKMLKQSWRTDLRGELILRSPWRQISNAYSLNSSVPNAKDMFEVPDAAVINVSSDFERGSQSTTIPMILEASVKGQGGRQKVKGNEEVLQVKYKQVWYNWKRKGIAADEQSVDGDTAKFYSVGKQVIPQLKRYFMKLDDYDHSRAFVEGADEYLTEAEYWTGPSISSPPTTKKTHPVILLNGASSPVTYSATESTYLGNIATGVDAMTDAANPFDMDAVNSIARQASLRLIPLNWSMGSEKVDFICLLTEFQAFQLRTDANWKSLMQAADPREKGQGSNRAISGILGVYQNVLFIENMRAPIMNYVDASGTVTFQYVTPWGDNRVRLAKANATSNGTFEIAMVMGAGALGRAQIKEFDYDEEQDDYNFDKGIAGKQATGVVRMDYDIATPTATSVYNATSFLYITTTPTTVL